MLAFGRLKSGFLHAPAVSIGIFATAIVLYRVHRRYFLFLGTCSTMRWNLMALLFTALIMFLFVGGTVWIMAHLQARLM